ncbi:hypothetical protein Q7C15_17740 [Aeromonas salmonicida]|uniref:hypothetical protein n=1 Tax=Aeromonas salmonicida TaxID=645 RepID=UPI0035C0CC50
MNKSRVIIYLFWIVYIAIELAFRSEMVTYVASVMHYSEVYFIEFTGRFIASVGFALFVYQFLSRDLTKLKKTGIIIGAFLSFFVAEKAVINMVAASLSDENKSRAVLLVNYKESVILGLKKSDMVEGSDTSPAGKTRLAFLPITNLGNDVLISKLKSTSSKDMAAVFKVKNERFYEFNTVGFTKEIKLLKDIYTQTLDVRIEYNQMYKENVVALNVGWPTVVKQVKFNYDFSHGGTGSLTYPTLASYLSSNKARNYVLGFTGLDYSMRNCAGKKSWVATDKDGMVRAIKQCISDGFVEELEEQLADKGVKVNVKEAPNIFTHGMDGLYAQPYFKNLLNHIAPYTVKPNGGLYNLEKLADKAFVRSIAGGLAEVQMRQLKRVMEAPEAAEDNERDRLLLESYTKSMIIPPFMIILSTIMIIINMVKFGFTVSADLLGNKKVVAVVSLILVPWVLFTPMMFRDGSANQLKNEGSGVYYLRQWSENTSEALSIIDHRDQPFRLVLNSISFINVMVERFSIPILSSSAADDYTYRMAAEVRMRDLGVL